MGACNHGRFHLGIFSDTLLVGIYQYNAPSDHVFHAI